MIRRRPIVAASLFCTALSFVTSTLNAQTLEVSPKPANPPAETPGATGSGGITAAEIEVRLAALEADKGIEDVVKAPLRKTYEEALAALESARSDLESAEVYRGGILAAPGKTDEARRQLEELPSVEEAGAGTGSAPNSIEDVKKRIAFEKAKRAKAAEELAEIGAELTRSKGRPVEIAARLPEATTELAGTESELADPGGAGASSPGDLARKTLLQAKREALMAEVAMLEQERLSQGARVDLLSATRDLRKRQMENSEATLAALEEALTRTMESEVVGAAARVEQLALEVKNSGAEAVELAREVRGLVDEYQNSVYLLKRISSDQSGITAKLTELSDEFTQIEEEAKLGGFEGAFAQILVEQRRKLPNPATLVYENNLGREEMREARLAGFQIEKRADAQAALEQQLAGAAPAVTELLALRSELLEKAGSDNRRLIRELAELDSRSRSYLGKVIQFRDYLREKLFWVKSSPPVGVGSAVDFGETMRWIFGVERWSEGWIALKRHVTRRPIPSSLILLAAVGLLLARPKIIAAIRRTGDNIRRISTDRYLFTFQALAGTALLTVPIPLAVWYFGRSVSSDPDGSEWLRGLSSGLVYSSFIIAIAWFLGAACIRGGIGIAHFGWNETSAVRLRRALAVLFVIYIPGLLITSSTTFEENSIHFDSVGRFCLNVTHLWATLVLWRLLRPSDGIFAGMLRDRPNRLAARLSYVWYIAALLSPLFLIVLACLGYVITAIALSLLLLATFGLVVLGTFAYCLTLRWFMVKERKLALVEAIEARKARKAAAANPEETPDEAIPIEDAELELDLSDIGRQTRRLLRSLASIGVVVALWFLWAESLPLDQILGASAAGSGISLFHFAQAVLIAATFIVVVKNLPGLLELAGLRSTTLDPGTRYAVITICQYALGAIGIVMVTNTLGIDWSRFGWIAAALSVGLGFGLQEVVANFVCGIILLFERPIRVGDIVTIENVTGTVTRIRMRATTITNWDRKEFVVPNKQFVTGTLMNWTLSSSVNRIIIEVGVAYGSDTEKARQILLDVACDHPRILDDPAPLATFELFADSSLNLLLRCYLPELDNRISVISDLHTEIDRRFQKAGIEIPFPQRDLHVRDVDPSAAGGIRGSAS